jgi:hypothetical protein
MHHWSNLAPCEKSGEWKWSRLAEMSDVEARFLEQVKAASIAADLQPADESSRAAACAF